MATTRRKKQAAAEPTSTLFDSTIICDLRFSSFRTRRKLRNKEKGEVVKDELEEQEDVLHLSKDILESPLLREVQRRQRDARVLVSCWALPTKMLKGGMSLMPIAEAERIDQGLTKTKDAWAEAVDVFIGAYPEAKERARGKLGVLFDERDYPTSEELRAEFKFDWHWVMLDVPDKLGSISSEVFKKEQEKARAQWALAQEEVQDGLRAMLKELLDHAAERLEPERDGKRKILRTSTLENITEFLDTFAARNVANDADLDALVTDCRKVLSGVSTKGLKDSAALRNDMRKTFDTLSRQIDTGVVKRKRAISLDDEAAA